MFKGGNSLSGPVVRTPSFHCHGPRFDPIRELRAHKSCSTAKKKGKKISCFKVENGLQISKEAAGNKTEHSED